eukprot:TRINITY_DN16429_c0_g1_i2.p1 TRINITY_DN16429_c0_g1~~TRINITY_DN16429_c0_g1_i2.p1  ORF type:complete len:469 (+),score=176.93 TRINITY_DN16429_c0_g1_i2:72-1409(+)
MSDGEDGGASSRTVFIAGIDSAVTPSQFERRVLRRFGAVRRRRICGDPSRGTYFGFFEFASKQETDAALLADGAPVGNGVIRCRPARTCIKSNQATLKHRVWSRTSAAPAEQQQVLRTVHISKIGRGVSADAIDELVSYAFYELSTLPEAQALLAADGVVVGGRRLTVQPAKGAIGYGGSDDFAPENATVHVSGIDSALPAPELQAFVDSFGEVVKQRVVGQEGWATRYGFFEYASVDSARRLVASSGRQLGGRPIGCTWARTVIGGVQHERCTVHLTGIAGGLPADAVTEFVSRFGVVLKQRLAQSDDGTQHAFAEFAETEQAEACIGASGSQLGPRAVTVRAARERIRHSDLPVPGQDEEAAGCTVFVRSVGAQLPPSLEWFLSQRGVVTRRRLAHPKMAEGSGFFQFQTRAQADAVVALGQATLGGTVLQFERSRAPIRNPQ